MKKCIQFALFANLLWCLFAVRAIAQPVITSFSPASAKPGDAVTLTGSGFNTTAANNIVFFGATRATVTAATATSITAIVPTGANYAPITLLNTGTTLACGSTSNFNPIYAPAKAGIGTDDFLPKVDFGTGLSPWSVAIGDLDGDGKPDLASVNVGTANVSVLRNTSTSGTVSFAAKVDFGTGAQPLSVAIGDVDGDGKSDLAVANLGSNTVSVLRNANIVYTFTGSGNWDNPSNWEGGVVPPSNLPNHINIVINPTGSGECILNVPVTVPRSSGITVATGKKFTIQGNLTISNQ